MLSTISSRTQSLCLVGAKRRTNQQQQHPKVSSNSFVPHTLEEGMNMVYQGNCHQPLVILFRPTRIHPECWKAGEGETPHGNNGAAENGGNWTWRSKEEKCAKRLAGKVLRGMNLPWLSMMIHQLNQISIRWTCGSDGVGDQILFEQHALLDSINGNTWCIKETILHLLADDVWKMINGAWITAEGYGCISPNENTPHLLCHQGRQRCTIIWQTKAAIQHLFGPAKKTT